MILISRASRHRTCACLLFLFLLVPASAFSGAWTREPGKVFVMMTYGYYESDEFRDRNGDSINNFIPRNPANSFLGTSPSTYKQSEASLYMELGLPLDFEFVASFPFFVHAAQDSGLGNFTVTGISDATVGLKYKWFDRDDLFVSAVQVDVGVPVGDEEATASVSGQLDQPIPLGDGEWDVAFRLIASRGFYPLPVYVTADFGYRIRTSIGNISYPDDLPWSLESGYSWYFDRKWFPSITSFLAFRGLISTKDLDTNAALALAGSATVTGTSPAQEFIDIQPGVAVDITENFGWTTSFAYTIYGKNTGIGWTVRSGLSYQN